MDRAAGGGQTAFIESWISSSSSVPSSMLYASGTGWRPPPAAAGAAAGSGSGAGAGALAFCCFAKSRGLVAYFFPSALQSRERRCGERRGRERGERGAGREGERAVWRQLGCDRNGCGGRTTATRISVDPAF